MVQQVKCSRVGGSELNIVSSYAGNRRLPKSLPRLSPAFLRQEDLSVGALEQLLAPTILPFESTSMRLFDMALQNGTWVPDSCRGPSCRWWRPGRARTSPARRCSARRRCRPGSASSSKRHGHAQCGRAANELAPEIRPFFDPSVLVFQRGLLRPL